MASHRDDASRGRPGEGRASAESLQVEDEQAVKDKTSGHSAPPRAGRTGQGAKAERPADSRARHGTEGATEPGRKQKAPSPAATEGDASGASAAPVVRRP
jgi:hypothetical protein